jgi:hypothetical protein
MMLVKNGGDAIPVWPIEWSSGLKQKLLYVPWQLRPLFERSQTQ